MSHHPWPDARGYRRGTESMQVDPAALLQLESAAASRPGDLALLNGAACAQPPVKSVEWVPEVEEVLVPAPVWRTCRGCPVRADCLRVAARLEAVGYWAGTTTRQREQLALASTVDLVAADGLHAAALAAQEAAADADAVGRLHARGEGSVKWYRRGCPCSECRAANTTRRAQERARARRRSAPLAVAA